MIDLSSKKMLSELINPIIDAALEKKRDSEKPRNYLGGSRLGVECDRALQYEFFNTPKDDDKNFQGRILRIFERGFWIEDAVIKWMLKAGVEIQTHDKNGRQFGFSSYNGMVMGHCDGIITGGPDEFGPFPRLWECKGLGAKYWRELKKRGLSYSRPVYYAQCQVYMAGFNLTENPALFTAVNADTMEIHWEPVPFNQQAVNQIEKKTTRIINACINGDLLPRLSQDPSFYLCRFCSYPKRCFKG